MPLREEKIPFHNIQAIISICVALYCKINENVDAARCYNEASCSFSVRKNSQHKRKNII